MKNVCPFVRQGQRHVDGVSASCASRTMKMPKRKLFASETSDDGDDLSHERNEFAYKGWSELSSGFTSSANTSSLKRVSHKMSQPRSRFRQQYTSGESLLNADDGNCYEEDLVNTISQVTSPDQSPLKHQTVTPLKKPDIDAYSSPELFSHCGRSKSTLSSPSSVLPRRLSQESRKSDESIICTDSPPATKVPIKLKGSDWLETVTRKGQDSQQPAVKLIDPQFLAAVNDDNLKKITPIKGGLAELLEKNVIQQKGSEERAMKLTSNCVTLLITGIFSDGNPVVYICQQTKESSESACLSLPGEILCAMLFQNIVQSLCLHVGCVLHVSVCCEVLRVPSLQVAVILNPLIVKVEKSTLQFNSCLETFRWRCQCSKDSGAH